MNYTITDQTWFCEIIIFSALEFVPADFITYFTDNAMQMEKGTDDTYLRYTNSLLL